MKEEFTFNGAAIPPEVQQVALILEQAEFEAYLVGGCVRDLILKRTPKDWDIATSATPEEIQRLFPDSVYENKFGTVGVKTRATQASLKIIEVTTYRVEGKYTDKRHPDEIKFAKTIAEDLSRRDFTVNAMALGVVGGIATKLIDPHNGQADLKNKLIRTVGDPRARFGEDALRLMRAVRLAAQLEDDGTPIGGAMTGGWQIELNTRRAIERQASLLERIAGERVRDELEKILLSIHAARGILLLEELNLLRFVLPELREGLGCGQNKHHIYSVFEHNLRALAYTARQNYSLAVRLAALLHDVGKPRAKRGEGPDCTFYQHEHIGAKMTVIMLDRLHFPKEFIERVVHLVRCHLFYYNVGEVTPAGVRRFLARVGMENVDDLLKVREADRIGSGVPKAVPYKLRHLQFMIEKVRQDPISPKMLKINGQEVMALAGISPGPKVGQILAVLLEEVIEDPSRNDMVRLKKRVGELSPLPKDKLREMSQKARSVKEEFESGAEAEIKKKYFVQ